jgi:hypothetical protein
MPPHISAVTPSSSEALHVMRHERPILVKDGITGEKWPVNLACDSDFHINHRVLLHGTDSFTSPLKKITYSTVL